MDYVYICIIYNFFSLTCSFDKVRVFNNNFTCHSLKEQDKSFIKVFYQITVKINVPIFVVFPNSGEF